MAASVPLSLAVQRLGLAWEEAMSLVGLVRAEADKARRFGDLMRRYVGRAKIPPTDQLTVLAPVTDGLTAAEVGRGRAFLKAMGLDPVAAGLGWWQGTGGRFHPIVVDDGCAEFVAALRRAGDDVEGGASGARRRLLNLGRADLLVLLDPPPKTLNPRRLERGAPPVRAARLGPVQVPPSRGLHPVNYVVEGQTGRAYSVLDRSDWPEWEALHDASSIGQGELTALTAHSVVPEDLSFLGVEEVAALDAERPDGPVGSVPVPDDFDAAEDPAPIPDGAQNLDVPTPLPYVVEYVSQHIPAHSEEAWDPTWFTARANL
jgi:hypothetical protein